MKKSVIVLMVLFSAVLFSCEKNQIIEGELTNSKTVSEGVSVINGRVVFKDDASYEKVYDELGTFSMEKRQQWIKSLGINTLGDIISTNLENDSYLEKMKNATLPPPFFTIVNKNGEFQIGSTIVWFDGNVQHFSKNESALVEIKKDPSKSKVFVEIKPIPLNIKSPNSRINLSVNQGANAKYQKPFTVGGTDFKHVYEVVRYPKYLNPPPAYVPGTNISGLTVIGVDTYVNIKLEYFKKNLIGNGGTWKPAGESRTIQYTLYGNVDGINWGSGVPSYGTGLTANQYIKIHSTTNTNFDTAVAIDVYGAISQQVNVSGYPTYSIPLPGASSTLW